MISVLLVDDSPGECERLRAVLESDPAMRVVATADSGPAALRLALEHRPDVVAMDGRMPGMDGLAATRMLMENDPRPIVVFDDPTSEVRAFEAGAVAAVRVPSDPGAPDYEGLCRDFRRAVQRSAGVRVVRRWPRSGESANGAGQSRAVVPAQPAVRVVAIGVSAGGPPVLEAILRRMPASFPVPILIVQHIAEGFVDGLVACLQRATPLRVRLAEAGLTARAGDVYVAPDGVHLGIDAGGRLLLDAAPAERSQRPAVSYLFRSVARAFGGRAAAVLLTGMGCDGAAEMKVLRDLRAVTIAQDARSSTVFGMPGEAIKLGAAQYVMSADEIGDALCRVCGVPSSIAGDRPEGRS